MADVFIDTNVLLYAVSTDPAEAAKVWSEDLNHGQDYGGVVVRNPFVSP